MPAITSRSTKAELLAQIAVLEAELRTAALALQDLRLQLSIAKAQPAAPAAPRAPRVVPARNHQLPAHFIAAREAAMRLGRSVRVEA